MSGYHSLVGTELELQPAIGQVPDGSYKAVAGGWITEFKVGDKTYYGKGQIGVRGWNISDRVTICEGEAKSEVIGSLVITDYEPKI